ncbi:hypothetical protein ABB07_04135 [Streptomyces incarnatus]|uniref:Uncharacterized protein n=1 Tax=Streptomyces incarnatus TaxID=665007 RepID=A0ABN4G6H0_9ACTN|nr:hypothetical protein ABB07_04135 [Streptomyces incarnatus]
MRAFLPVLIYADEPDVAADADALQDRVGAEAVRHLLAPGVARTVVPRVLLALPGVRNAYGC